jgi:hypothetical protein
VRGRLRCPLTQPTDRNPARQPGLDNDQQAADADQYRHNRVEGRRREPQEQSGTGDAAQQRGGAQSPHTLSLAMKLAPHREGTGQ